MSMLTYRISPRTMHRVACALSGLLAAPLAVTFAVTFVAMLAVTACSPSSLVDVQAPSTAVDPAQVKTASGALMLRAAAVADFTEPFAGGDGGSVIFMGGLLTDELTEGLYAQTGPDERRVNDPRFAGLSPLRLYLYLHQARTHAQMAREALRLYAANTASAPPAWQGELFAMEGYTVLWFAENFCSGIPLTSVALSGVAQPTAGFTTQELFTRAAALFDSAIVAGADSARFVNLAKVGKGRALLGLGNFAAADSAVRDVPTDFVYLVQFTASGHYNNFVASDGSYYYTRVQDHEGTNGLVWSTDPRTVSVPDPSASAFIHPGKYNVVGGTYHTSAPSAPVRLADGLEARLIQAEAALAAGDASWLTTLNTLRSTCVGAAACAPVSGLAAGALPALADPGTPNARLDTLMKERAMWLYLTGHREGDLRRLAHVYHRDPATLWPTGTIVSPAFPPFTDSPLAENGALYGNDMVFTSDPHEHDTNPLYDGCYDFNP